MSDPLLTELGRYDRAAIVARAKEIHRRDNGGWGAAMGQAYREAGEELKARTMPHVLSARPRGAAVRDAAGHPHAF